MNLKLHLKLAPMRRDTIYIVECMRVCFVHTLRFSR